MGKRSIGRCYVRHRQHRKEHRREHRRGHREQVRVGRKRSGDESVSIEKAALERRTSECEREGSIREKERGA